MGTLGTVTKKIDKGTGGPGNKKMSRDYPNYSIVEIGQNAEKRLGDLRKLAVTQTPVRNNQLTLEWKIPPKVK